MTQFIPKEEIKEKESIAVKIFFWFVLLALIVSGGLSYLIDWKLSENKKLLTEVENRIVQVGTPQQKELKDSVSNYKKKFDDMAQLLTSHKIPTKVFSILESNIHPKVYISDMLYTSANKGWKMNINGVAADLISLAQQIKLFQECTGIERVLLSSVNTANQQITFKIELTLKESSLIMQ